jgi:tRNA pseudouridine32 synthase/23S rRNA pseudouridine746 synthase
LSLERNEFHIELTGNNTDAVELLATATGLSRQKIKQAMQQGAVWLTDAKGTHRLRRHSKKLIIPGTLHFYFDSRILDEKVAAAILVADEGDYSVWFKPKGMLSQGSKWGDHSAINRWVEMNIKPERPAFIVHRLDRFASGLILLAHKKKTATALSALFQNKKITKKYKVIVHGLFPDEVMTFNTQVENKPAASHVSLLQYDEAKDVSLVQVDIETGRKHQIRIHLATAGFPVVGDRLHGDKNASEDLQLTAYKLSFISPVDGSEKEYLLAEEYQPGLEKLVLN